MTHAFQTFHSLSVGVSDSQFVSVVVIDVNALGDDGGGAGNLGVEGFLIVPSK